MICLVAHASIVAIVKEKKAFQPLRSRRPPPPRKQPLSHTAHRRKHSAERPLCALKRRPIIRHTHTVWPFGGARWPSGGRERAALGGPPTGARCPSRRRPSEARGGGGGGGGAVR
jgi:hypothetical protein